MVNYFVVRERPKCKHILKVPKTNFQKLSTVSKTLFRARRTSLLKLVIKSAAERSTKKKTLLYGRVFFPIAVFGKAKRTWVSNRNTKYPSEFHRVLMDLSKIFQFTLQNPQINSGAFQTLIGEKTCQMEKSSISSRSRTKANHRPDSHTVQPCLI